MISNKFILSALALGMAALVAAPAATAVQEVGAGKTHATIQAAITASAGTTDTVVVFSGTYAEDIAWDKTCDIVEAPGETAVISGSGGGYIINPSSPGDRTMDGIDIQLRGGQAGAMINNGPHVIIQNCNLTDVGGDTYAGAGLGIVANTTTTLQNVNITLYDVVYGAGFIHRQGGNPNAPIQLIDCDISARGQMVNAGTDGSIKLVRTNWVYPTGNGAAANESYMSNGQPPLDNTIRQFVYEDSTITGNANCIGLGLDNANVFATGSKFQFTGGLALNAPRRPGWVHSYINCSWILDKDVTFPNVILNPGDGGNGTLIFEHSTFVITDGDDTGASLYSGGNAFDVNLVVNNSILWLQGSTVGIVQGTLNAGTVTAGTNLRFGYDGAGTGDVLTGTIIDADPLLDTDFIHLTVGSPAIDAGVDIGATSDIDGDSRPLGAAPDLGADEFQVPASSHHWSQY
jgi:hypothetical protein